MTRALFAMLFMPVATSCSNAASDSSTDMSDVVLSDDMGMSAEVDMSDAVACEQTSHFPLRSNHTLQTLVTPILF